MSLIGQGYGGRQVVTLGLGDRAGASSVSVSVSGVSAEMALGLVEVGAQKRWWGWWWEKKWLAVVQVCGVEASACLGVPVVEVNDRGRRLQNDDEFLQLLIFLLIEGPLCLR